MKTKVKKGIALRCRLLLLAAVYCAGSAAAATYYLSPSGDDSHSGRSPRSAWRTLEKLNTLSFAAGDRILLEGGKSFQGPLELDIRDRGQPEAPIEIGTYRLREGGPARILAGRGPGIHVHGTSGLVIRDLVIMGDGVDVNRHSGILIYTTRRNGASHIRIDRVDVSGFGEHGISIGAWKTRAGYRDIRITHCKLHDNLRTGLKTWGPWGEGIYAHSQIYIAHCLAYRMKRGSGITLSSVDGGVVEKSVAHHNGRLFSGAAGIWAWDSNNILFQFNESHHNQTIEADGDGFNFDGGVTNSVMQYNYSHDNDAAGFLLAQYVSAPAAMRNITIRHNISENDCRTRDYGAIHVWNGDTPDRMGEIYIYSNTVYLSPSAGDEPSAFAVVSPTRSIYVMNNLFITSGGRLLANIVPEQKALHLRNNSYWSAHGPFRLNWRGRTFERLDAWLNTGIDQKRGGGQILAIYSDPDP